MTIEESARRAGAWAGVERSLYEIVGGWTVPTGSRAAKIWFSEASQHHAWRAQLWEQRLPGRLVQAYPPAPGPVPHPGATTDELVVPPPAAAAAIGALAGLATDGARLGAYCRVILTRCIAEYRGWQERCSSASDRPVARVLMLVLADTASDWQRGHEVLNAWLVGPGGREGLADVTTGAAALDAALAGGGLVPFTGGHGR